jgi:hypothetical protein
VRKEGSPIGKDGEPTPTHAEILDWQEGRLDADRIGEVLSVMDSGGSEAREFADWMASFRRDAEALPLVAPPPLVSQRLRRMYGNRLKGERPIVHLFATLEIDSRQSDSMVSVRAPMTRNPGRVQLAYRAGATSIIVDLVRTEQGAVTLRGQVLAAGGTPPVFQVTARGPSGSSTSISADDLGGFVLESLPDDTELLLLTNDELLIEVPLLLSSESD